MALKFGSGIAFPNHYRSINGNWIPTPFSWVLAGRQYSNIILFCCACWLTMTHKDSNQNILLDQLVVWIFLFSKHLPLASIPWNSWYCPHWELKEAPGHHLASKWLDALSSSAASLISHVLPHYHINWCSL